MRALKWILVNDAKLNPKFVQLRYSSGEIAYQGAPLLLVKPGNSSQDTPEFSWIITEATRLELDRNAIIDALNKRNRGRTNLDETPAWSVHA